MDTNQITMYSLPLEIVQQIADWVERVHRPSLFAFGLASKACHRAAASLIFRKIVIMIEDPKGLQRDARRLVEDLSCTGSAHHVRSITVRGSLHLNNRKTDVFDSSLSYLKKSGLKELLDDEEFVSSMGRFVVYDEGVIKESSAEDMAWAPFLTLLDATVGLRDLIYDCRSQLPPSLLRNLHKQHPLCRLHHLTFHFRTLLWGVPYLYEMELATSLSLYRLKVVCTDQDSDGDFDYNMDAVMELSAGLAPNLKEVSVTEIISELASSRRSVRRPLWQGLPGYSSEMIGSLTSLSLDYGSPDILENWARHTDFSKLEHLRIGKGLERKSPGVTGEGMEWMTRYGLFPNLRTLYVNLYRNDNVTEKPHYCENAISFFQSLNSLEELTINGAMEPRMIETILTYHGPTLKKLGLEPSESIDNMRPRTEIPMQFTEEHILQINALCPVLEKLAITVMRDSSSASEATIYKCFSKMGSLQSLFLTLDCANWRISRDPTYDPHFEREDDQELAWSHSNKVKRGHVRGALINSAVDEGLARSIWERITENKTGKRLERLKLWTRNGGVLTQPEHCPYPERFTKSISRSWLFECSPRDDIEEVTVKELMQHVRESHEREIFGERPGYTDPVTEQIFHSIWPPKDGSRDWRDSWSSFPFQG